ncbi:MAG: CYTH domain-containing protein [Treponema sp.]|nr:CYTH domain-containing protein [Treponema sp.]MBP3608224.1 CYTH domain-containing protein [Treponema sp.]MBQ7882180.1 CYTH domain-containing protein [Treponema sp.]
MYEIELKAIVKNRAEVIKRINKFATYTGAIEKEDNYYSSIHNGKEISVRIRKETPFVSTEVDSKINISCQKTVLFTYKRKKLSEAEGTHLEVNDEKECLLSDSKPFEEFLQDSGFTLTLSKKKKVLSWQYDGALFELCTVPPLGDFLEIEIMSKTNKDDQISVIKEKLISLLKKCNISEDMIEKRYYSELLKQKRG